MTGVSYLTLLVPPLLTTNPLMEWMLAGEGREEMICEWLLFFSFPFSQRKDGEPLELFDERGGLH